MWQRFSEQSRQAILFAQQEAQWRGEVFVDTEHLLLGVLRIEGSAGEVILRESGATLPAVRAQMPEPPAQVLDGEPRLCAHSKRALELSADEARRQQNSFIGTGHMAIALARVKKSHSASILQHLGVTLETLRARLDSMEGQHATEAPQPRPRPDYARLIAQRLARWLGRGQ